MENCSIPDTCDLVNAFMIVDRHAIAVLNNALTDFIIDNGVLYSC